MEGMSTPAFTEQAIKNFAIKWSIEYSEDDYAYVYVKVGNNNELEVTQVDY